jgi:hypothetical protein
VGQVIKAFKGREQISIIGIKYSINPVLTCDLKALMWMMGLYSVTTQA